MAQDPNLLSSLPAAPSPAASLQAAPATQSGAPSAMARGELVKGEVHLEAQEQEESGRELELRPSGGFLGSPRSSGRVRTSGGEGDVEAQDIVQLFDKWLVG